jgi:ABC-type lipoprotein export system ATPase subunit
MLPSAEGLTKRFDALAEVDFDVDAGEVRVGTLHELRTAAGLLTGAQRQSVATTRSLLGRPRLVILDEPTAALGVAETVEVLTA